MRDILDWLKLGDIVFLTNGIKVHYIFSNGKLDDLDNIRSIYVNCSKMPGLLDKGEWEYYIQEAGYKRYTHKKLQQNTNTISMFKK